MNPTQLLEHFDRISEAPDAIPRLRRFILDLAVRGKLVEQDPNDEPAVELLKRIFAWRTEAIRQKQIREPRKPLKKIGNNEAPYLLPPGWVLVRLGEVINIQSGDGLTAANMKNGDIPVFGGNGINGYHDKSNVERPTLVIGRVGYYCGSIHVTPDKAWVTDNAFITRFCGQAISLNFLVLLLSGTNLKDNENATAQPVISGSKIYPIVIGLPPLAEQHRIVAKVDELMALCDQLEAAKTEREQRRDRLVAASLQRLNQPTDDEETFREDARFAFNHLPRLTTRPEHVKQLRQTILNLALSGRLVPHDPHDEPAKELLRQIQKIRMQLLSAKELRQTTSATNSIDKRYELSIHKTWAWAKCSDLLFVTKLAGFEYTKYFQLNREGQIPVIRAQNVRPWTIDRSNIVFIDEKVSQALPRSALTKPCMLVTFIGAGIGDVALFDEPVRWHLAPNVAKVETFYGCEHLLNLRYLVIMMNAPFGRCEIFKHIKSTAQPSISMATIRDIDIPLPPLAEQHRIVAKVDELMAICDQLETQITATETDSRRLLEAVLQEALAPALEAAA